MDLLGPVGGTPMNSETDWYAYLRGKYADGGPLLALMAVGAADGIREPAASGHEHDRATVDGFARDSIMRHGNRSLERYLRDQLK